MTIVQLEYFLAAAAYGSLTTAAEHCFVTSSALSMQITGLENDLGVILLDRSKKPIVLTEVGEEFIGQAKEAIAAFYKTKEQVNNIKGKLSGRLRIGVIPTISPYLMPGFITRFIKKCPDIKVRIYDMYTADLVEAIALDKIDIAILSGGQSEVKIKETDLFDDKLYVYVSPKNKLYGRKEVLIEDIEVEKLLILSEGNCLRNQTLELCMARKDIDPQFDFVRSSLESLMLTVDQISGTTVIPGMAIKSIPENKRDRIIPFGRVNAKRKITVAIAPTFVKEAMIKIVKETIIEVAKEDFVLSEFLIPV
ncbi:MAG: hydrogen peroxide-inducible genes activator [Bacteroidales bacterium]|jgi:LysR family hydrogen peroxide-inducible transcriptional activator|nr:hydrogen peroxide-inducible genes activator [Bacteroidales bacterium]